MYEHKETKYERKKIRRGTLKSKLIKNEMAITEMIDKICQSYNTGRLKIKNSTAL